MQLKDVMPFHCTKGHPQGVRPSQRGAFTPIHSIYILGVPTTINQYNHLPPIPFQSILVFVSHYVHYTGHRMPCIWNINQWVFYYYPWYGYLFNRYPINVTLTINPATESSNANVRVTLFVWISRNILSLGTSEYTEVPRRAPCHRPSLH
jgi:hypothetical protein